ncbi:MAG: SGNH/GDSL hydrolase family protein [Planctomycetota bacterium]|nr:SGNH/GDSL hydrolase family protein [Planctomycetota bacterium]
MEEPRRDPKFVQVVAAFSLASTALLALAMLSRRSGGSRWVLVTGLAVLAIPVSSWIIRTLARRGKPYKWVLVLALANLLLIVPELSLRVAQFRYQSGIEFGYPRPETFVTLVPDRELFWIYPSDQSDVNSLGFKDAEPVVPKPEGSKRILFLGDSCTEQGFHQYVELVLNEQGDIPVDCMILAAAGYSSHQGRVLSQKYLDRFEPDLVFVYYGWNDHWQAYGSTDAEKAIDPARSGRNSLASRFYNNCHLWQAIQYLVHQVSGSNTNEPIGEVRVPPDTYQNNLEAIGQQCDAAGIPLVLVTAPSSYATRGIPDYLVERNFVPDKQTAQKRHNDYVELTRQVAREGNHLVLDLARDLADLEKPGEVFMTDGIHFQQAGLVLVTDRVVEFIRHKGLLGKSSE